MTGGTPTEACEGCIAGKMARSKFPAGPFFRSSRIAEVMHSDVCGPFSTGSSGAHYFVTFIDDISRFIAVYPIKNKSDVLSSFKGFIASLETEFGRQVVKELHSDNGGEYIGKDFKSFCTRSGIKQVTTVPHTPQQNGIAERANRTLVEGARSMMLETKMPRSSWDQEYSKGSCLRSEIRFCR